MPRYRDSFLHLDGNVLAAVDVETSGKQPGYHEVVQIGIQVLDGQLNPHTDFKRPVFYLDIKPNFPERCDDMATQIHGLDTKYLLNHATESDLAADLLLEWYEELELPFGKTLIPLAHAWASDSAWLKAWIGVEATGVIFHSHARDTLAFACLLNDKAAYRGEEAPFKYLSLKYICEVLGIKHEKSHDALADAVMTAEAYKLMLQMEF